MNTQDSSLRVVVTGMGVVSALGVTLEDLWRACSEGRSGVRAKNDSDSIPVNCMAPADAFTGAIQDFKTVDDAQKKAIRKGVKLMAREIQMGVATAQSALLDARVNGEIPQTRVGVSYASDFVVTPPQELTDAIVDCGLNQDGALDFAHWAQSGLSKMTPLWQLKYLTNMSASHITIYNQFYGPAFDVTNREASFAVALAEAVETIKSGRADCMVVGATGTRIHPYRFVDALKYGEIANEIQDLNRAPALDATRPFDARRTGAVPGEGAAAIVIETEASAKARGVKIYAEIVGGAHRAVVRHARDLNERGCDVRANRETLRESFRLTLDALVEKAQLDPRTIGFVNANARGDRDLDAAEALALRDVFGDVMDALPVASLKGHIGNPGAGSGAIETIAGILALQENALFPTLNYETADPDCPVTPTREYGAPSGDSFVKLCANSIGQTSALYVRRYE
ncbi:MAG: beta-ketoacyl-[Thermoguttaceae bacterium]|nr:beta-ketoacyl-[acyl-carrier-protein] synthase family protein [Thermoguttaceae bacterium]